MMTGVLCTVDQMMYDLLFDKETDDVDANGMPIKGFFGKVLHEMDKAGISLNEAIDDAAEAIDKNGDRWIQQSKDFAKEVFDIDVDSIKDNVVNKLSSIGGNVKDAASSIFTDIKNAVTGTVTDVRENNFNQQNKKKEENKEENKNNPPPTPPPAPPPPENRAFGQFPAIVSKGEAIFNSDGSGTKNVTKSGVTAIDSNSLIIPSDKNPWNPRKDTADPQKDLENENRIKSRISSRMKGEDGAEYADKLPGFASGKDDIFDVIKSLSPGELVQAAGPAMNLLQNHGIKPSLVGDLLADYLGDKAGGLIKNLNLSEDDKDILDNTIQYIWHTKTVRENPELKKITESIIKF
jgi:hypothetical protein